MSLVECDKIIVKETEDKGLGAFTKVKILKDFLVEKGVIRRIDYDGNQNPYLFTWSVNKDVWGFASGCATFYNTSLEPNCKLVRHYDTDTFEIYALRDIEANEELTHKYQSLEWRECFKELKDIL
tara:strand:+ start:506 stop:880 length:375 start_codon:yes stop_codon:yes gene_type:complete